MAFVNCLPVIGSSAASEWWASSFWEWIAYMVTIHIGYGTKLLSFLTSASADECVNRSISAYQTMARA